MVNNIHFLNIILYFKVFFNIDQGNIQIIQKYYKILLITKKKF